MKKTEYVMIVVLFFIACLIPASCRHDPECVGVPVSGNGGTWTTVVYMAADNDLEGDALEDLNEMISAADCLEESGHTFLVLLDRSDGYDASAGNWTDTRLFKISPDIPDSDITLSSVRIDCPWLGLSREVPVELDMASPETLRNVLLFAQEEYSADNYALIIWGHGCGWRGYSIDEDSDSIMILPRLHDALASLPVPLSVIAFDCCYGGMLETAYELRNDASILIATERDEPAAGWNYSLLLQRLTGNDPAYNAFSASERYAYSVISAFSMQYAQVPAVSLSAWSLEKIAPVFEAFDEFASSCAACLTTRETVLSFVERVLPDVTVFLSGEYPAYEYADIESLADAFTESDLQLCDPVLIQTASDMAETLKAALSDAVLVSFEGGTGVEPGISDKPLLGVYLATVRSGGVVDADYQQLYIRGSGIAGQCAFVRDSEGWVPQRSLTYSMSLLDHLFRMPLP